MTAGSNGVKKVVTTYSTTTETTCPADSNPGQTTGGHGHALRRLIEGIDKQIAGLHEVKNALEQFEGAEEVVEWLKRLESKSER